MLKLAGAYGVAISEFWDASPFEFWNYIEGRRELFDEQSREAWEQTRTLATIMVNSNSKHKYTPMQVLRLPWDTRTNKKKTKPLTDKEFYDICLKHNWKVPQRLQTKFSNYGREHNSQHDC